MIDVWNNFFDELEKRMTEKPTIVRDEVLKPVLIFLLETHVGVKIQFFDALCIFQLEDGRYAVYEQPSWTSPLNDGKEHIFGDAEYAVNFFLKLRHQRKIGRDYQTKWPEDYPVITRGHYEDYHTYYYEVGGEG